MVKNEYEDWLEALKTIEGKCISDSLLDARMNSVDVLATEQAAYDPASNLAELESFMRKLEHFINLLTYKNSADVAKFESLRLHANGLFSKQAEVRLRARIRSLRAQFSKLSTVEEIDDSIERCQERLDMARSQNFDAGISDFTLRIQILFELRKELINAKM